MNRILMLIALALVGCGKPAEPTKADEPKPPSGTPAPSGTTKETDPNNPLPPTTPGPVSLSPNAPAQQLGVQFIQDLRMASEKPDPLPAEFLARLSPAFLKVIGKPLRSDDEKKAGYSSNEASAWLKNLGTKLVGVGLPTGFGSPAAAVLTGSFGNGSGRFLVRMTFHEGWKVDWVSLGIIAAPIVKPETTEGSYQDFAVLAFLDALTGNVTSKDDRVRLLAAMMAPKLKNAWAEPFEQDKSGGLDYNPTKLGQSLETHGGGVTAFTRTPTGDTYKIELTKGKTATNYTLKLVKGSAPGEWLVDEFTKQ